MKARTIALALIGASWAAPASAVDPDEPPGEDRDPTETIDEGQGGAEGDPSAEAQEGEGEAPAPVPDPAPEAEPEPPPKPSPATPADTGEVDVITSAGRVALPAEYQPSIILEGEEVTWDPRWQKFELGNWVATGAALAIGIGSLVIPPEPDRWDNPTAFDFEARKALKPKTETGEQTAADASDILLTVSINHLLIDTLVVTWWGHDAETVAYQMALINVETLAFNTALQGLVSGFVSRERPYARDLCGPDDEDIGDCRSGNRYRSFYSGHSSATFAVAGATCMHHAYLPLYGGGAPDVAACGFSIAVAGATATLRVVADRHWLSDVLTGAAVGTFSGLAIPYFLHYRTGDLPEADGDTVSVNLVPTPGGALMTGLF